MIPYRKWFLRAIKNIAFDSNENRTPSLQFKDNYGNYALNAVNNHIDRKLKFPALILRDRGVRH
jgi:hypothetical protein